MGCERGRGLPVPLGVLPSVLPATHFASDGHAILLPHDLFIQIKWNKKACIPVRLPRLTTVSPALHFLVARDNAGRQHGLTSHRPAAPISSHRCPFARVLLPLRKPGLRCCAAPCTGRTTASPCGARLTASSVLLALPGSRFTMVSPSPRIPVEKPSGDGAVQDVMVQVVPSMPSPVQPLRSAA